MGEGVEGVGAWGGSRHQNKPNPLASWGMPEAREGRHSSFSSVTHSSASSHPPSTLRHCIVALTLLPSHCAARGYGMVCCPARGVVCVPGASVQRLALHPCPCAGVSVRRGVEVSRAARWLEIILERKAAVNPNLVGLQPTPADLKAMLAYYKGQLTQATTKHKAFYMGDGQQRALPTDYGLGRLWGQDSISATVWYEVPVSSLPPGATITVVVARDKTANGTFIKLPDNKIVQLVARQEKMSLWGLGNMMFANMDEVMHMAANVSSAGRLLDSWPPFRVCVDDSNVIALSNGYKDSMDAMAAAAAGPWVACLAAACSPGQGTPCPWLAASPALASSTAPVGEQRYMIYSLFMVVPVGLLRGLATAKHNLEADGEEDEDDDMLVRHLGAQDLGAEPGTVEPCTAHHLVLNHGTG
ncbi:tiny macrocysts protein C [Haematococcus lacustris]|uniref:Tiny macrocysts protein C n=1 Tax=Haematococcus lacustris TaxID=44745 RepID=A0A699Z0K1_HAELA|nr:tiny macrocysts protein C [Haematococcus lacustris]